MEIFSGYYRGTECSFGIYDQTSGEIYAFITGKSENALAIIESLDDKTASIVLGLPRNSFHLSDIGFHWTFMFDQMKPFSLMEFICHLGKLVDALYQYGIEHGIIDKA